MHLFILLIHQHQSDYCGLFAGACWSCLLSMVRVGGGMEVYVFSAGGGREQCSLFLSQTDRSRGSAHIRSRVSAVSAQTSIISTCWSPAKYVHCTQEAEPNDLQLKWHACGLMWFLKPVSPQSGLILSSVRLVLVLKMCTASMLRSSKKNLTLL